MDSRKITDPINRGMVGGLLGVPAELGAMFLNGGRSIGNLANRLAGVNAPPAPMVENPVYGQEWWGNKMQQAGYVSPNRNKLAEFGAGLLDPGSVMTDVPMLAKGLFGLGDPATLSAAGGLLGTVLKKNSWFDEASGFLKQIENLSEKNGKIYVRWSGDEAADLAKGAASRDYLNGGSHAGLSAIPITGDMHPSDIAKRMAEYNFLRMQNKKSRPRLYLADKVGEDSDGYDSISNLRKLTDVPDSFVSAIDKNFAKIFDLNDDLKSNTEKLKSLDGAAKEITLKRIEDIKEKLKKLGF